jgi:O-succinylbenzoate synthase
MVGEDVELVLALRSELGGDVELRLDANRAWSFEEAAGFARGVAGVGFAYIEEPLAEPSRLPELARECGVAVALDESLVGMAPEELEDHRYARAVVLKPTLLGGIPYVLRLANKAGDLGMTPVVSSAYESGVGMMALISVSAALAPEPPPAGLDTYRRLAGDTIHPRLDLSKPTVNLQDLATLHVVRERQIRLP